MLGAQEGLRYERMGGAAGLIHSNAPQQASLQLTWVGVGGSGGKWEEAKAGGC